MNISKEEARLRVKSLIDKYNNFKEQGLLEQYNEDNTCKDFILPLFSALGWGTESSKEVEGQKNILGSRVDYAFYLEGISKFFLEAKSIPEDLNNEKYIKQAINYSYHKGVTWAVLTNFVEIKVFNSEWHTELPKTLVLNLSIDDYLINFDLLWELSKEGFEKELLYERAKKFGQVAIREPVGEKLYKDLTVWRKEFFKYISGYYTNYTFAQVDEIIQRILNRFVFIRTCEDRNIEPLHLLPLLRERRERKLTDLQSKVKEIFRYFDKTYNSKLFNHHPCDDINIVDEPYLTVIDGLYGSENEIIRYDFNAIGVDILGRVYEQYLGYVAKTIEPKKKKQLAIDGLEENGGAIEIEKEKKKRKEQGIYYTPTFIVDYIVKNALKPVLDNCTSVDDLKKIKVLDPACGSGSFLIKALEVINDKYKDFNCPGDELTKIQILEDNIYGVDLDEQAIEITRLNLLLNSLDRKKQLPILKNIRNGNSLISGSNEELKKYFGENFCEKKSLNWQEEFPEVFKQGGFDVIIGNPPYGAELSPEEKSFFSKNFKVSSTDTAILFVAQSLNLLKPKGRLGFIIPKAFCFASNYKKIREILWDNIETIIDCGKAWSEVKLEQIIQIFDRGDKQLDYLSGISENNKIKLLGKISKKDCKKYGLLLNGVDNKDVELADKIREKSVFLNTISVNQRGAILQRFISTDGELEVIGGAQVQREGIIGIKGKIAREKVDDDKAFIKPNAVLVQRIISHIEKPIGHIKIIATVPNRSDQIIVDTINQIIVNNKHYSPFYICALLNSKLINWYAYRFIFGKAIRTMQFDNPVTERIPIPNMEKDEQSKVLPYLDEIRELSNEMKIILENSEEWNLKKEKIYRLSNVINQEIYHYYDLTPEEIEIVEKN